MKSNKRADAVARVVVVSLAMLIGVTGCQGRGSPSKSKVRAPKLNAVTPPAAAPDGMVWVPGGEFYMGDVHIGNDNDVHLVYVDGFWMDKYELTNEQFAKFVAATGYQTDAEKQPDPKDFPKPFSLVFKKPARGKYSLNNPRDWWDIRCGACWKSPEGPDSTIKGREKHPVVHVSHTDAVAYCKWARKRLPTEAEWEFAARGGLDRKKYTWGNELTPNGKWMANIWQGEFPVENTRDDGFEGTAPVGSFPANGYGLYDMAGNAWEWCADWYQRDYYRASPTRNPQGPDAPDRNFPNHRVQRGGSFLCAANYCTRYLVGARGKCDAGSAQNHCGFRCVKDAR